MKRSPISTLLVGTLVLGGVSVFAGYEWNHKGAVNQQPAASRPQAAKPPLSVGDNAWERQSAPLPVLDGEEQALDHWKGKVILLNFWASWCAPCQYEIPALIELQKKHESTGLQILGIGVDKEKPLRNVSRSLGINYPVLVADDSRGRHLLQLWGNSKQILPYNVVIGRDGRISHTHLGLVDQELFNEYVAPLLRTP